MENNEDVDEESFEDDIIDDVVAKAAKGNRTVRFTAGGTSVN